MVTDGVFDVSVVQYHLNRAHLQRGDAATALPLAREAVAYATTAGLKFILPWHEGVLGYALLLHGQIEEAVSTLETALQRSDAQHQPTANVRACAFLAETLLQIDPQRALAMAEAGLNGARTFAYRAQEAELLRVKAAALACTDLAEADARAQEGLALARELRMRPEEGHAHRVLGDVKMTKGESTAAREFYDRAGVIYQHLGMRYWLEGIWANG